MLLGLLAALALAGPQEADGPPTESAVQPTQEARFSTRVVLFVGAGAEPVRGGPDMAIGRMGVQFGLAERLSIEVGGGLHGALGQRQPFTGNLTMLVPDRSFYVGRLTDPVWTADVRAQLGLVSGSVQMARREVPLQLTLDVGAGAIATSEDLDMLQCSGVEGEACLVTANQVHPVPLLGGTLAMAPSERVTVRGVVQWRTWVETIDGTSLERLGSTTFTLELGMRLGRTQARDGDKFDPAATAARSIYDGRL